MELGIFYDFLRIIRRTWKCKLFIVFCMDMLFWGFVAGRTFSIMHTYSNGTLRWFAILGILSVLFGYFKWVSRYIVVVGTRCFGVVWRITDGFKRGLTKNIKLSIIKLGNCFRKEKAHGEEKCVSDEIS